MRNADRTRRCLAVLLPAVLWVFLVCLVATLNASAQPENLRVPQPSAIDSIESIEEDSSATEDEDESDWEWSDESGTESGDVVRMGEDIEIAPGREVGGDVVAIGGNVTIYGRVKGDVVAVGGSVHLKSNSVVDGDAVSVGGKLDREEGAELRGQEVNVGVFPLNISRWFGKGRVHGPSCGGAYAIKIWWDFLKYVGFFLVGMILILAFPERMVTVRQTVRSQFWLSVVAGVGSTLGVAVLLILLTITCIGILVAVPGIFLTILAMVGSGAAAIALFGEVVSRRPVTNSRSMLPALLIGLALFFAVQSAGRLLQLAGGAGDVIGGSLLAICRVARYLLVLTGFGALVLSRLGKRVPGTIPVLPPAAPVIPPPPPPTA